MLEKRNSSIHGYGLFATQNLPQGKLVINWLRSSQIVGRKQYSQENQTAIRLFGYLYIDGEKEDTDYINHSDKPNCVYLFGMVFTRWRISEGTELTVNYSHFIPEDDVNVVRGISTILDVTRQTSYLLRNWRQLKI